VITLRQKEAIGNSIKMSQKIKEICCEIIEKCVSEFKEDNNLNKVKKKCPRSMC